MRSYIDKFVKFKQTMNHIPDIYRPLNQNIMFGKFLHFLLLKKCTIVLAHDSQSLVHGTTTPNLNCIIRCVMNHL